MFIVQNGEPKAVVLLSGDAGATAQFAARELVRCVEAASGAKLPVVSRPEDDARPRIVLEATAQQGEVFSIEASNGDLRIRGDSELGLSHGVFHLLEKHLGCLWPTPGVEYIPSSPDIEIPADTKERSAPATALRSMFSWHPSLEEYARWTCANRNNCLALYTDNLEASVGLLPDLRCFFSECHSVGQWLPAERYYEAHQDYYAVVDGQRPSANVVHAGHPPQMCFSNRDVPQVIARNIKAFLKEQPQFDMIAVGPSDGPGWCECADCRAKYEPQNEMVYRNPRFPKASRAYLGLLNEVADSVASECPDTKIVYLAYTSTAEPPADVDVHPNIIVWYCTYWRCSSHAIHDAMCEVNHGHNTMIRRWIEKGAEVVLWEYLYGMSAQCGMPYPLLSRLIEDWPHYQRIGVSGTLSLSLAEPYLLNCYLASRLAWDPQADMDETIREFCRAYYGRAADEMGQFFRLYEEARERYPSTSHLLPSPAQNRELLSGRTLDEMFECLHAAGRKEQDSPEGERVAHMLGRMEYTRLCCEVQDHVDNSDTDACLQHARDLWSYNQKEEYHTPHLFRFVANEVLAELPEPRVRAFLDENRDIAEYIAGEGKDQKIADAMNAMALACIR